MRYKCPSCGDIYSFRCECPDCGVYVTKNVSKKRRHNMEHNSDLSQMSKEMILSELNALNISDWTRADIEYREQLWSEWNRRIEDECKQSIEQEANHV